MASTTHRGMDWSGWVDRWDRQQERYLPHREERFAFMLDVIAHTCDDPAPRVLDLCCGNGSISRRLLERFPAARVLAVDVDPVNLEIGRRTLGDRVEWREVDLRSDAWAEELTPRSFDTVVTATAIHWFLRDDVARLYGHLAAILRPGGVFLNADHMPVSSPAIAEISRDLLGAWKQERLAGAEDYATFREATASDPALAELALESGRWLSEKPPGEELPLEWHRAELLAAGFREVEEIWRHHTAALLVALR